jgi:uncharacterized protein with NRDE domain
VSKWLVSIEVQGCSKEVEADSLVEAGDKVAKWAEDRYGLWNWLSLNGRVEIAKNVKEKKKNDKSKSKVRGSDSKIKN